MRSSLLVGFCAAFISGAVLARQPEPTVPQATAVVATPKLTDAQIEDFLLHARVTKTKGVKKGVTATLQATLSDGKLTHDAQIQNIDERQQVFTGSGGTTEFDFRDSWSFNVAGYRVDRLIGMNMVPVSVERKWNYKDAAFTWWIDDVTMDEEVRTKEKKEPPNTDVWNQQMQMVRTFDELIANVDR